MDAEFTSGTILQGQNPTERNDANASTVAVTLGKLNFNNPERKADALDAKQAIEANLGNNADLQSALQKYERLSRADELFNTVYPPNAAILPNNAAVDGVVDAVFNKITAITNTNEQGFVAVRSLEVFDIQRINGRNPGETGNLRLHVVQRVFEHSASWRNARAVQALFDNMSNDTLLEVLAATDLNASNVQTQLLNEFERRLDTVMNDQGISDATVRDRAKLHLLEGMLKRNDFFTNPNYKGIIDKKVGSIDPRIFFEIQKKKVVDKIQARGGTVGSQNGSGPLPNASNVTPPGSTNQPNTVPNPYGSGCLPITSSVPGDQLTIGAMPHNSAEFSRDNANATQDEKDQFEQLTAEIDAFLGNPKLLQQHIKKLEVNLRVAGKTEAREFVKLLGHRLNIYAPGVLLALAGLGLFALAGFTGAAAIPAGLLFTSGIGLPLYQRQFGQAGINKDLQEGKLIDAQTQTELAKQNREMGPRQYVAAMDANRAKQHADAEYLHRLSVNPNAYTTEDQKKNLYKSIGDQFRVERFQLRANLLKSQIQQMYTLPSLRQTQVVTT